jgi:hypothetical protein
MDTTSNKEFSPTPVIVEWIAGISSLAFIFMFLTGLGNVHLMGLAVMTIVIKGLYGIDRKEGLTRVLYIIFWLSSFFAATCLFLGLMLQDVIVLVAEK